MRPIALSIAGSDSGGGAGIQADLKTFHQFGVYGTTVIVALTAQNTQGVRSVLPIPDQMVADQLEALADDLPPVAVKTGMLGTRSIVRQVARAIERHRWTRYVLDPVMVATSGDRLLEPDAVRDIGDLLVPQALVVTPNLAEAAILTDRPVTDPDEMEAAGRALVARGARAALIKGGHLDAALVVDVLVTADGVERFTHPKLATRSTHGTGCTLSAALTARLALDPAGTITAAARAAVEFVHRAIAGAPGLGHGNGPVDHWARTDGRG